MTFLACAALLTSAVVITGCKNDSEPQAKAPKVTTDIAISLPNQVGGPAVRHMPGRTVQTDGPTDFSYNGMANITLIPFAPKAKVSTASVRFGDDIALGTLDGSIALSNENRARNYSDQQVPQGTTAFLFYGESGKNSGAAKFDVGQINGALTGNPAAYKFELQPICTNTDAVQAVADLFNAYLNQVIIAQDTLYSGHEWRFISESENKGYKDMFDTLKTLNVLTTYGVERMMTDLYHSLDVNKDSLAKAIRKAILNPTYASLSGSGASAKVQLVSGMQNFPKQFNIPEGAVSVVYSTSTNTFGANAAHSFGGLAPADLASYVYPASLWYFANTLIKTSSSSKGNYTAGGTWKSILATYENNEASVNSSTRSIALIDTIQYGVARLDVQVKLKDGTSLMDNNPVESLREIANPDGGYPLKAVLIGNQKNVGFDFTPATYAGDKAGTYVIYDTVMSSAIYAQPHASVYSAANSTLVLETPADAGAGAEDVFVALEFENNTGKDFYGVDRQMIPAGGRFYMVGKLEASEATETGKKVFKQDYTTTARFSINSLTKAYSAIPDLKAPQLEIGMSVDLYWSDGHDYEINL